MIKKYIFNDVEYTSEYDVRQAIFEKSRVAFGKPQTAEEWLRLGVKYLEEEVVIPLDTIKTQKLNQIKQAFLRWRESEATLISSLGFKIDSNERANTDIGGLLVVYEDKQDTQITFRDADNRFHELTLEQLRILQKEIIENGSYAYAQKWAYDAQVESATCEEEVKAIVVKFVGKDFTVVA